MVLSEHVTELAAYMKDRLGRYYFVWIEADSIYTLKYYESGDAIHEESDEGGVTERAVSSHSIGAN